MEAEKKDEGKLRYDLLPPEALEDIVKILTDGCAKYGSRNWEQGMEWNRCFAAAQRHLWAWQKGQDKDPESGSPHLAHAAVNLIFLLTYNARQVGRDDRAFLSTLQPIGCKECTCASK